MQNNPFFFFLYLINKNIDMTLVETIHKLKDIALRQPNVRSFVEGDIYDILNGKKDVEYGVIVLTQGRHTRDEYYNNFNFNIFYVDRLVSDLEDNRLQVQSIGIEVLTNLIKRFCDKNDVEFNNLTFDTFTEKFGAECAGVFATISLQVEADLICGEYYG